MRLPVSAVGSYKEIIKPTYKQAGLPNANFCTQQLKEYSSLSSLSYTQKRARALAYLPSHNTYLLVVVVQSAVQWFTTPRGVSVRFPPQTNLVYIRSFCRFDAITNQRALTTISTSGRHLTVSLVYRHTLWVYPGRVLIINRYYIHALEIYTYSPIFSFLKRGVSHSFHVSCFCCLSVQTCYRNRTYLIIIKGDLTAPLILFLIA